MLDLWRWRFDFLLRRRGCLHFGSRFRRGHRLTMGRRHWSRLGRGDFSRRCFYLRGRFWRRVSWLMSGSLLALPVRRLMRVRSVLASLGSGSPSGIGVDVVSTSSELALRRCEESQKHAVYSAQAVDYLLALASDFRPAGSLVILVGPESPMALERSDSAGSLAAHLAILPEHFRLATFSVQVSPAAVGFPPGPGGEPPGVPEGFAPSRFGGTDFFPAAAAFGEAPGLTFAFGEPAPGLTKLGGVFCPATAVGEPVAPGDPRQEIR